MHKMRELLEERAEVFRQTGPMNKELPILRKRINEYHRSSEQGLQTLKSINRTRGKNYSKDELQSKNDRVAKLQANLKLLGDILEHQNKEIIKARRKEMGTDDAETLKDHVITEEQDIEN